MPPAPIPSTEPDSLIDISGVSVQIARKTKITVRCFSVLSVRVFTIVKIGRLTKVIQGTT